MNVEAGSAELDRRAGRAAAHRALAQRPGRDRLAALGARRARRADGRSPTCSAALIAQAERHADDRDAGLHPPAAGAAGDLRPPSAGLCRDVRPRPRPLRRRARAGSTNARSAPRRWPARRSRSTATMTAEALGFERPTANSLDAVVRPRLRARVSRRGVDLRRASVAASPRSWCSGRRRSSASCGSRTASPPARSIMPQKRNPDAAELVRGKAGRILGALIGAARGDEGPAARLCQGHAGGQGAAVRRRRHPGAGACRHGRHGRATSSP